MPAFIKDFDENVTALLIETRAISDEQFDIQIAQIEELLKEFEVVRDIYFTKDVAEYTSLLEN
jgi:D-lactate dehydrogenase